MSTADNDDATATADEPEVEAVDGGSEPEVDAADGGSEPEAEAVDGGSKPEVDAVDGGSEPEADAADPGREPAVDVNVSGPSTGPPPAPAPEVVPQPNVSPIELAHLQAGEPTGAVGNLDLLRDIELSVTVEVGRARLRVRDLLALHEGSIVELDRPVGSPVDLLANGRAIARGEIVLVEDQLGIRVTAFNSDAEGD